MEREIKFRAWDGEQSISPDYVCRNGYAHWRENSIPTISKTVEQYIGLKDKKNKKAYVGDICQETMLNGEKRFYKIFNVKGGFAINTHQDDFNKNPEQILFYESLGDMQTSSWFERSVEIIGNIHESPKEDKPTDLI